MLNYTNDPLKKVSNNFIVCQILSASQTLQQGESTGSSFRPIMTDYRNFLAGIDFVKSTGDNDYNFEVWLINSIKSVPAGNYIYQQSYLLETFSGRLANTTPTSAGFSVYFGDNTSLLSGLPICELQIYVKNLDDEAITISQINIFARG